MKKLKIPKKLIRLIKMSLADMQNKIAPEGRISNSFREETGDR